MDLNLNQGDYSSFVSEICYFRRDFRPYKDDEDIRAWSTTFETFASIQDKEKQLRPSDLRNLFEITKSPHQ